MNVLVCAKRVPDTETRVRIAEGGTEIDRSGVKHVLSPYDEFALEAALQVVEGADEGKVTVLTFGGEDAKETLRSALALGADEAVLLQGEPTMDGWATAQVLAAGIGEWEAGADGRRAELVLFGVKAVDDDQQQVGPMVAELLGRPCATAVAEMELGGGVATCKRTVEGGRERVEMDLPAVATITKGRYEPRYASLRGIMAAKRKPLVEIDAGAVDAGLVVERLELPPARPEGRIVGEGPPAAAELVRLLREEAKVL